jgi:hypothetical protein
MPMAPSVEDEEDDLVCGACPSDRTTQLHHICTISVYVSVLLLKMSLRQETCAIRTLSLTAILGEAATTIFMPLHASPQLDELS